MFVRTRDGRWINETGSVILPDSNGGCWFEAMSPTDHFDETADELAALLNGAAQPEPQPRMVELTRDNGKPWAICPADVASVIEADTGHCYVTAKGDANECYRVIGTYAETKRLLFGDGPTAAKDGANDAEL